MTRAANSGERPVDDGHCFGCGRYSDSGLHLNFTTLEDESVRCEFVLPPHVQGWRGIAHGGIVALVLDEAMAYAAGARGHLGMTAEMKMRFRQSVPLGESLVTTAAVLWQRRNVLGLEARIETLAGTLLASATGSFVSRGTLEPGERLGA